MIFNRRILVFLLALIVAFVGYISYKNSDKFIEQMPGLRDKVIRFHVIANSDSVDDQAVKLRVRDRLLKELHSRFENVNSIEEERRLIKDNLSFIQEIANDEILKAGKDYKAKVYFGNHQFPTRVYGDMVFPAGTYEALRVVIGQGQGANWWCVMFPPLCFIDMDHGITPDQASSLYKRLEFNLAKAQQAYNDNPQSYQSGVQFKFKFSEWIKRTMPEVARILPLTN